MKRAESRRETPWDGVSELTPTQEFLREHYAAHYADRHRAVSESGEAEMINFYAPGKCPHCQSEWFRRYGTTKSGVQRYHCGGCGKTFLPTTGTIFDEHRISISEWMEYCLNLFRHVSITADSWNNKNAFNTSRYWLEKLFLTLEGIQDKVFLTDRVWLDETFYSVRSPEIRRDERGNKLPGLSKNQICIGVATDKKNSIFLVEGTGKPSQKKTLRTFQGHIQTGSTLVHDGESSHIALVEKLSLISEVYDSKSLKNLPDKDNPLDPVNRAHAILKKFLRAHSSFIRGDVQGYLNLFAFVTNPPDNLLEKVELVIKMAFENPNLLRYRDYYSSISTISNDL